MLATIARQVNLSRSTNVIRRLRERLYTERVMFVHVPKCGGTSLSHVLRARYALSYAKIDEAASARACETLDGNAWFDFKRGLASYYAAEGAHFVQGHFCVDRRFIDTHAKHYRIITVLRNPVDRFVSHYHFDKRYNRIPFDEFTVSPTGRTEGRVLCHFFGELPWDAIPDRARLDAAVATAVDNLSALAVVGFVEDPERMDTEFEHAIGFRPRTPVRNVGRTRQRGAEFTPAQLERVDELCADDARIYAAMRERPPAMGIPLIDDTPSASSEPSR